MRSLDALLASLFDVQDLRIFISRHYSSLKNEIAFSNPLRVVALDVAEKLEKHGMINDVLWARLAQERPDRRSAIESVRALLVEEVGSTQVRSEPHTDQPRAVRQATLHTSHSQVGAPTSEPPGGKGTARTASPGEGQLRASSSGVLRILHISDLHERAPFEGMSESRQAKLEVDAEERGYVLGPRFLEALEQVAQKGVDLVCFTGDLADWGHPAEYNAATTRLEAILGAVGVSKDRFFPVPGNHDVQRNIQRAAWQGIRDWYAETHDSSRLGRWFRQIGEAPRGLSADWQEQILERTEAFWTWLETFGRGDLRPKTPKLLGYRHTLPVGTFTGVEAPVHIIGLDSAWLCGADDDQGRILLTEEQVQAHIRSGAHPLDGLRLALVHHPLDHLADHHQVRRLLGDGGVDLLLHGHQHAPLVMTAAEPGASLRVLAAGCLIEGDLGKNWPNGFHLIEIEVEPKVYTVHFRKWARDGRFWAKGTDLYREAPDGVLRWAVGGSGPTVPR
jgi:predicted MPP superfamily phosphohydrolase